MKLTVHTFLSVDGVMQGPGAADEDRRDDFTRGGWLAPHFDDEVGEYIDEKFGQADAFLLGRRTYDIFAGFWPNVTDPDNTIAARLNGLPKYVVSRTLTDPQWAHATVLAADEVGRLKGQPGGELQVHGSGELVRFLLAHDLVDELRLFLFPVIVGQGRRLFPTDGIDTNLQMVESRVSGSGVAIHAYRPAGRPEYGEAGA